MEYEDKTARVDALLKEIRAFRPLSKALLNQVKEYYRVGLTYSSNALEGNTLTETETKVVLEDGLTIAGKPLRDHYEASGHSEAFDAVSDLAKKKTITERDVLKIHELFYHRISPVQAGKYRKVPVVITGTEYVPPSATKVPTQMKAAIASLAKLKKQLHPIAYAAKLHSLLVDIHPFVDGNGRTARLLMNLALMQAGYPITLIPPVRRADYISLVKKSQTGKMSLVPFTNFVSCCVHESAKDYLRLLKQIA